MYTCPIEVSSVRYNAAEQSFEAAVTVHDNCIKRTYACAIQAPITTDFAEAAEGLSKQAVRRHQQRGGLFSEADRTGIVSRQVSRFDPSRWMRSLLHFPGEKAA